MMRGTNPFVAVGLAGLAGLALLFAASKAGTSAGPSPGQKDTAGRPVPPSQQDEPTREQGV